MMVLRVHKYKKRVGLRQVASDGDGSFSHIYVDKRYGL